MKNEKKARYPEHGTKEVSEILEGAEEQFPGISELLEVYGGYEEMVAAVQEYLELTRPEPFTTTTNRSYPEA
ncbi:MAG: hypothetical protein ACE5JL_12175 [Dehalococcoidia bacterium]